MTASEFHMGTSSLSHLQAEILKKLSASMSFVADMTRANLSLYVPHKEKGLQMVADAVPATLLSKDELLDPWLEQMGKQLAADTFQNGKKRMEWHESEHGTLGIQTFAVQDYGDRLIGVVVLSFRLLMPLEDYRHLLRGAELVLFHGNKFPMATIGRLTIGDGILIADCHHRIIFAGEIVRHIFRAMGIGSLVGRNLLSAELRQGIDREITTRDAPWEKEIQAGSRTLMERRLDFSEGGNTLGHILILSDITQQRQLEQEARIQEALMQRIEALEDELEQLKDSLETRKLLDRAKGILMSEHNLTEMESYRRIQRYAMMKRLTIKEVAEAVVKAAKK